MHPNPTFERKTIQTLSLQVHYSSLPELKKHGKRIGRLQLLRLSSSINAHQHCWIVTYYSGRTLQGQYATRARTLQGQTFSRASKIAFSLLFLDDIWASQESGFFHVTTTLSHLASNFHMSFPIHVPLLAELTSKNSSFSVFPLNIVLPCLAYYSLRPRATPTFPTSG